VFLLLLLLLWRTCNRLQGQTSEAKRRREGDSLYIQCPYPEWFRDGVTKYWCREKDRECEVLVQTYYSNKRQSSDGRITIKDDSTSRTVSITMTDLKAEDSGSYFCAYYDRKYVPFGTISLNVFKGGAAAGSHAGVSPHVPGVFQGPSSSQPGSQATSLSNDNTLLILSVVLLILLILAVLTSITLSVRYYKLLGRTGNREAEDTNDRAEGTAQLGSTGRRESSQDDSKGPGYINMDVPPPPSPEDPLYCNVEPSQAHRKLQNVEYAVIAFNHAPRNDR
ncbi:CLM5 protein, partial [Ptilonorhynchus violaceus]|nr:CLM5 protein [Ptilonorhynchus violaceus]